MRNASWWNNGAFLVETYPLPPPPPAFFFSQLLIEISSDGKIETGMLLIEGGTQDWVGISKENDVNYCPRCGGWRASVAQGELGRVFPQLRLKCFILTMIFDVCSLLGQFTANSPGPIPIAVSEVFFLLKSFTFFKNEIVFTIQEIYVTLSPEP